MCCSTDHVRAQPATVVFGHLCPWQFSPPGSRRYVICVPRVCVFRLPGGGGSPVGLTLRGFLRLAHLALGSQRIQSFVPMVVWAIWSLYARSGPVNMHDNRCDNGEDLNSSGQSIGKTHRTRDLELLTPNYLPSQSIRFFLWFYCQRFILVCTPSLTVASNSLVWLVAFN